VEALGFVPEGIARRAAIGGNGEAVDVLVHSLIPDEFRRLGWAETGA
jgi:RimJ/RimL family protein N-acetyltransferase